MSSKYVFFAMEAETGNPMRKSVLLGLADVADNEGVCFPSYQYIADKMEMSKRTVIAHVEALEKMGFLSKEKRHLPTGMSRSNVYRLMLDGGKNPTKIVNNDCEQPVDKSVDNSVVGGAGDSLGGAGDSLGGGAGAAPITCHSLNLSLNTGAGAPEENKKILKFNKPSLVEVADFAKQLKSKVDPNLFFNHYEKNGWLVGRELRPMRDWKETFRFWDKKKRDEYMTRVPANDDELESWAAMVGLRKSRAGESYQQYRVELIRLFDEMKRRDKGD